MKSQHRAFREIFAALEVRTAALLFTRLKREDLYTTLVNPPILWRQTVARAEVGSSTIHRIHRNAHFCKIHIFFFFALSGIFQPPMTFALVVDTNDTKQSLSLPSLQESDLPKARFQRLLDTFPR